MYLMLLFTGLLERFAAKAKVDSHIGYQVSENEEVIDFRITDRSA